MGKLWLLPVLDLLFILDGCRGIPTPEEKQARREVKSIKEVYRPQNQRPLLPALAAASGLSNYLYSAMLNQPEVEARIQRELALAELSLVIAGKAPQKAPIRYEKTAK